MRVLLAVDASPDSRNAAQIIQHLADPPELHVLNVVDLEALKHGYVTPGIPADYYERYRSEVSEVAERVLYEIRDELRPYCRQIRLIADTGDAADSIVQTAEETKADLVILGQRGMTATYTFLLGGVSQKVATYAPCSVLVVKGSALTLNRVLLAVDGSEHADKATQFLLRTPFKPPLRLTIVTVWPARGSQMSMSAAGHLDPSAEPQAAQTTGEDFRRGIAERFRTGPYEVETEWLQGDPPFAILDAAARHGAQVIVVGARGMKAIKRFLLGSVSQKILVHASCSVLIVR